MFINRTTLFFLLITVVAFSQTRKKVDTIFVHEKVFVYKKVSKTDTKIKAVGFDSITRKKLTEVKPFAIKIVADTILPKTIATASKSNKKEKSKRSALNNYGLSAQSLFSQLPDVKSYGGGIGIFASKNIYRNKLFVNVEFMFSKVFSQSDTKEIDGYFITPDAVLYYQAKNVNTQQIDIPVIFSWKYKRIKSQFGIAFTKKQTELDFFSYRNNSTQTLIGKTSYKLANSYLDLVYGIEYDLNKRFSVSLRSKQTLVKTPDNKISENLKSLQELHFFPNQVIFGMKYNFKRNEIQRH